MSMSPYELAAQGISMIYNLVSSKSKADDTYKRLYPVLIKNITMYGRDDPDVNNLLLMLGDLPSYGIQRTNFKRRYIEDPLGWKKLPKDPSRFPYGYWW